jgi:hypothetical protein
MVFNSVFKGLIRIISSYIEDNKLCLIYEDKSSNAVQGNNHSLFWELYEIMNALFGY